MQLSFAILAFAATVVVQPLVDSDVLEPSVRNEVEHALARAPKDGKSDVQPSTFNLQPFPTNGMCRSDIAIRLVSEQRADGRWRVGTNDVTAAAVEMLRAL